MMKPASSGMKFAKYTVPELPRVASSPMAPARKPAGSEAPALQHHAPLKHFQQDALIPRVKAMGHDEATAVVHSLEQGLQQANAKHRVSESELATLQFKARQFQQAMLKHYRILNEEPSERITELLKKTGYALAKLRATNGKFG
jgi:hypothetical protein